MKRFITYFYYTYIIYRKVTNEINLIIKVMLTLLTTTPHIIVREIVVIRTFLVVVVKLF